MLKKINIGILVFLIGCSSTGLFGQNSSSSPYSMFGVGDIANNGFGRTLGMGGVSTPLISNNNLNPSNPASYIGIMPYSFIFELGLSGNNYTLKTPEGSFSKFDGNIKYIAVGFPLTKWWKAGVGLRPITDIGYDIKQEYSLELDSNRLVNAYNGEGGVNSFYFDNSFVLNKWLSVGLKSAFVFGTVDRISSVTSYNMASTNILTVEDRKIFRAFSFGFGTHFHKTLGDKLFLNVGATYNLKTNLSADYERLVTSLTSKVNGAFIDTLSSGLVEEGVLELPQSYGIGASIVYKQKLELAFDYQVETWSKSEFFGELQNFKDNERLSVGLEYTPEYNSIKYFKAVRYRLGFSKSNSYLMIDNQQLEQIGGSFGLGFPLRSGSHINFAALYSKRTLPGDDRLSENYFQFHLNFSLQANWFYRSKFE